MRRLGRVMGFGRHIRPCGVIFVGAVSIVASTADASPATEAAAGVMHRLIGDRAVAFEFSDVDPVDGRDVFEVEARGGRVRVSGSSGVAMTRGAYEYLRRACNASVAWEGSRLELPASFPDFAKLRVVCPNRYRHYFNVVTFGYTMVWWDWERWQREIDWMALHGINLPMAMNGQEAIWQRVWKGYGLSDDDLARFFSGPAFLPWHRMGNLNGHGGPLPQRWIDSQRELQKKILARERALGMTPITPAFSGFVPEAFAQAHSTARFRKNPAWAGFEPTILLDASDPLFAEVGARFIREYVQEFGSDHLYLADTFNEMLPQVKPETRLQELTAHSQSVYRSLLEGDPQAIWVMQGWLFLYDREFWKTDEVRALLEPIPDDRMLLIDLACEQMQVWRKHEAFRKKNWLFSTVHNFGQNTPSQGDLALYAKYSIDALRDPTHGKMAGMGITAEGVEHNAVVYELLTDMMWRDEAMPLDDWIAAYCTRRYGVYPSEIREAWDLLRQTVYAKQGVPRRLEYTLRPSLDAVPPEASGPERSRLEQALDRLLAGAERLGANDLYRRDVVDVAKRLVEEYAATFVSEAIAAHKAGDRQTLARAAQRHAEILADLDKLLATRPEYRLARWIDAARAWAVEPGEADLYERNARLQITVWGGGAELADYARKEWAGLTSSFHAPRWRMFFDALLAADKEHPFDPEAWGNSMLKWETRWAESLTPIPAPAAADAVDVARELLAKYQRAPGRVH